jgi:tRNA (guanine-N7-)-methyltransferase
MAKHKLRQFAEIESFKNVFHHIQKEKTIGDFQMKGNWKNEFFKNSNPLVLELGCGKGEYTIGLAAKNPNKSFIGIDLKGNRIWRGAKTAIEEKMENVAFLRTRIENIESCFSANEVDEIWITFPDPQPQKKRIKKRLTSPNFLNRYRKILKPKGWLHLKTDNAPLYEYTIETLEELEFIVLQKTPHLYSLLNEKSDLVSREFPFETFSIQTFYEKKFSEKGFNICYVRFMLKNKNEDSF